VIAAETGANAPVPENVADAEAVRAETGTNMPVPENTADVLTVV
jgi:hypothetical protein